MWPTTLFDPMAKLAKRHRRGRKCSLCTVVAVAVGYLVFADRLRDPSLRILDGLREAPFEVTLFDRACAWTADVGDRGQAYGGAWHTTRGRASARGMRRSRSAAGLPLPILRSAATGPTGSSSLPQTSSWRCSWRRPTPGLCIHSLFEVFLGGLLGALLTLVIFQVFWA